MSVIAVMGEGSTTTTLALAAAWPGGREVVAMELDPSGGDLAAWLDVPQHPGLSSLVASAQAHAWPQIAAHVQSPQPGFGVLVAPVRATEAAVVVREAASRVVPTLAALEEVAVLVDCGRVVPQAIPPAAFQSAVVALVVRQRPMSGPASVARLDRCAEIADVLTAAGVPLIVCVSGPFPYGQGEIAAFISGAAEPVETVELPEDPHGAAVLAGRPSGRRSAGRSRLVRAAGPVAAALAVRAGLPSAISQGVGR